MSATLGGRRLRRDGLFTVRKDEPEEPLEAMEEDESPQFLRAHRVIACSSWVERAPRRPPARRKEPEDAVEDDFSDVADPSSVVCEDLSPR